MIKRSLKAWKSTGCGVGVLLVAIGAALQAFCDNDPETVVNVQSIVGALAVAIPAILYPGKKDGKPKGRLPGCILLCVLLGAGCATISNTVTETVTDTDGTITERTVKTRATAGGTSNVEKLAQTAYYDFGEADSMAVNANADSLQSNAEWVTDLLKVAVDALIEYGAAQATAGVSEVVPGVLYGASLLPMP
ncbi:MAG: hypothetical protein GY832_22065 [Chloroflexi bacterium]|nr:hypothetical protein [Chloroflexota bacterium]